MTALIVRNVVWGLLLGACGGALTATLLTGEPLDRIVAGALTTLLVWLVVTTLGFVRHARRQSSASAARSALYAVHSSLGAALGCVLFAICLTGSITVFRDELRVWANPSLYAVDFDPAQQVSIDSILTSASEHVRWQASPLAALRLPTSASPAYELIVQAPGSAAVLRGHLHPNSGVFLGLERDQLADFLFQLHSNLSARGKWGRYVVGVFGIGALLLLISGVLTHRHMFREAFRLRWAVKLRITLSDVHKLLGTWGLPLLVVVTVSGVCLALKDGLLLAPTAAVFRGNLRVARAQLAQAPIPPHSPPAAMVSLAPLVEEARRAIPGFVPRLVVLQGWGRAHARVDVSGALPGQLLSETEAARVSFDAVTGEVQKKEVGSEHALARRTFDAMTPLHYGDFAGAPIRILYILVGLLLTTLTWTGTSMWLIRRRRTH